MLRLSTIRADERAQPRAGINYAWVKDLAEKLTRNGEFSDPIVVFQDSEKSIWLADGFHRLAAAREAGRAEIAAEVQKGTLRDAILYGVGANDTHGLPRTNEDKRYAVLRLLKDAQWAKWSDREIARRCAVDHVFVGKLRATLSGDDHQMRQPGRKVSRGGAVYTQDTTRIGRGRRPGPEFGDEPRDETDPQIAIQLILDRVRIVFDGIRSASARHEVVNALIKHFRDLSVRMNQESLR